MRSRIYDENEKSGKINRFISAEPSCTVREKMDRNEVIGKMRLLPRLFREEPVSAVREAQSVTAANNTITAAP